MFNTYGGGPIHPGGYSTQIVVHKLNILVKFPDNIPLEIACTLPYSYLPTFTALKKARSSLEEGLLRNKCGRLLVAGAGGLGLWCTRLAKLIFAGRDLQVTVADVAVEKLDIAKTCGADKTVRWKPISTPSMTL